TTIHLIGSAQACFGKTARFERKKTSTSNLSKKLIGGSGAPPLALHFIHSEQIFDSLPPDAEQRQRLLKATGQVKAALGLKSLIFDADGQSNQGIPFVLYSNPNRDLTDLVKKAYQALPPDK
ncbi:hypothetical protein OAK58_01365, partial [bacterium]|nr:hypothetical protein [bacterium]